MHLCLIHVQNCESLCWYIPRIVHLVVKATFCSAIRCYARKSRACPFRHGNQWWREWASAAYDKVIPRSAMRPGGSGGWRNTAKVRVEKWPSVPDRQRRQLTVNLATQVRWCHSRHRREVRREHRVRCRFHVSAHRDTAAGAGLTQGLMQRRSRMRHLGVHASFFGRGDQ